MSDSIRIERRGAVFEITLNRPGVRNALDETLIGELRTAMTRAGESQARVVVLRGEGKTFCAGADIGYMQRLSEFEYDDNVRDARELSDVFLSISNCDKPVVARVHGAAIGGGVGLVAAADVVLASEETKFGLAEVRLGILPAVISPFVLRRLGPAACRRLFLTGERFTAPEAHGLGLVDRVVARDDLDSTLDAVVSDLILGGPTAQTECKRLLDEIQSLTLAEACERTPAFIARQRATDEAREGFAAFFEKRKPSWSGEER